MSLDIPRYPRISWDIPVHARISWDSNKCQAKREVKRVVKEKSLVNGIHLDILGYPSISLDI
jgi:hypothetical protein